MSLLNFYLTFWTTKHIFFVVTHNILDHQVYRLTNLVILLPGIFFVCL